MRVAALALMGALTVAGSIAGLGTVTPAHAQSRGYTVERVGPALPIRIRPRSWLDGSNVVEPGNGSVSNPATNPQFITASYLNTPPYGRNDRFGAGNISDPITNGPFVGARSSAIRGVDFSAIDVIDPTSYAARYGSPY
ncbi:hypothetical protein [Methylobacterium sp. Leaf108]|uniref:hypothetical protein n=1 Tax=Methylobacterium sp. Leaf108 TaxID=1736256 RepID=UPI000700F9B8|nr:hypothetical protein [Methylobacterium sp. Leaf108]KQP51961.1 hypothetical protein ASF39_09445 [Methylobacterium sp. Leaf108]